MQNYKELLETFPEARTFLKKDIASFRKEAEMKNDDLRKAVVQEEESGRNDKWFYEMRREDRDMEYKKLCRTINRLEWALNPHTDQSGQITDADIDAAKQVPLSEFIEFNHSGYAICISHDENTPSMFYYKKKNNVHCFSCGFHQDSIGVIMKLRNFDFLNAVRFLTCT